MIACFRELGIDGNIIVRPVDHALFISISCLSARNAHFRCLARPSCYWYHCELIRPDLPKSSNNLEQDEVTRETEMVPTLSKSPAKRPNPSPLKSRPSKRVRTDTPSPQKGIDTFFSSQKQPSLSVEAIVDLKPHERKYTTLYISDAKTRQRKWLPSDEDTEQGRMQLSIYRKFLCDMLQTEPPFDFNSVWEKLRLDPATVFPTKFLQQARLLQPIEEDLSICLNDLAASWHRVVKDAKIDLVSPKLQLVYYLRPSDDAVMKGKKKATSLTFPLVPDVNVSQEDEDLARAIAVSLQESAGGDGDAQAGPSHQAITASPSLERVGGSSASVIDLTSDSEDALLLWALQDSMRGETSKAGGSMTAGEHPPNP